MTEQLKPCGRCGNNDDNIHVMKTRLYENFYLQCGVCGQPGTVCPSEDEARQTWNERVIEDDLQAQVDALVELVSATRDILDARSDEYSAAIAKCRALGVNV